MITLLLVIPLIGCLCIIPFKERDIRNLAVQMNTGTAIDSEITKELIKTNNKNKLIMKQIALFTSLLNLLVAIGL
jgi:hypothetical protein